MQNGFGFVEFNFELFRQASVDLLQAFSEIAIIVDRVNDRDADSKIGLAGGHIPELPEQMLSQRIALDALIFQKIVDTVVGSLRSAADPRSCNIIDIFPLAVDRKLIREVLIFLHIELGIL